MPVRNAEEVVTTAALEPAYTLIELHPGRAMKISLGSRRRKGDIHNEQGLVLQHFIVAVYRGDSAVRERPNHPAENNIRLLGALDDLKLTTTIKLSSQRRRQLLCLSRHRGCD